MNNKNLQKSIGFVFSLILALGLLLPASPTSALPQKEELVILGISTPDDPGYTAPGIDIYGVPGAPGSQYQWNYQDTWGINVPAAWNITNGSASTVVAVIDSGMALNNDLDTLRILDGYDFITDPVIANDENGRDADPRDEGDWCASPFADSSWHGMHVAGIIGATSNNDAGVAGINWAANILPVRVSGECGAVTATDLMDGISWAADSLTGLTNPNPANVINVSVGVPGQSCTAIYYGTTTYQDAITTIVNNGTVIVAAAGDNNSTSIDFPANCDDVITVAATDAAGNRASYSNNGSTVEISAPGGGNVLLDGILSTTNSGTSTPNILDATRYTSKIGTGIAAAHVSGVVSLMLAGNPDMTTSQILQTLQKTAKAFPSLGTCTTLNCGSGIVDAGAALKPDLIITNMGLAPLANENDECPASQPGYSPGPFELFCVNITVKNQGGSNSAALVYRNIYIDRDPYAQVLLHPDPDGCILDDNGGDDFGDYYRQDLNSSIPAGDEVTQGVKIRKETSPGVFINGLDANMHKIYAYTDAQCIVAEVIEDNNNFANTTINPPMFPDSWTGGAVITSDRNVVAVGRPHIGSEIASYDSFMAGALTAYIPMLFKNAFGGAYDSAFYIQNLHNAYTASVSIKYYDSAGHLTCTVPDTVTPLASKGYWLPSISAACLPDGWVGGAVVTSNQPIVAIGRPHVGAEVMTYDSFPAGSLTSYLPMLFRGAFGGTYNAAFYIQNVGESLAHITIKYYDSAGNLTCSSLDTIESFASKGYWLPSTCVPVGWVGGVVVTSDLPIVTVGRPHIGTQVTTYNGFSAGGTSSYVPMLFKNAYGGSYDAALYIQNVNASTTANLTIKYYNSLGVLTCTATDTVAPLASKGYWLPTLLAANCLPSGLPDGWVGAVVVTSDQSIVTIGRPHLGAQVTTYNGFSSGSLNSYLPMLFKNAYGDTYDSAFYIQNTDPLNAALVTVKLYDTNGTLDCTRSDTIPALSTLGYWVPALMCDP